MFQDLIRKTIKDAHREKVPSNKTPALRKSTNMGVWAVGTLSQLFIILFTKLFVLTLVSDMAVLYGNDAFSILVRSTKKRYSSFLKKVYVF